MGTYLFYNVSYVINIYKRTARVIVVMNAVEYMLSVLVIATLVQDLHVNPSRRAGLNTYKFVWRDEDDRLASTTLFGTISYPRPPMSQTLTPTIPNPDPSHMWCPLHSPYPTLPHIWGLVRDQLHYEW